jgi:hypothetical protein
MGTDIGGIRTAPGKQILKTQRFAVACVGLLVNLAEREIHPFGEAIRERGVEIFENCRPPVRDLQQDAAKRAPADKR